MWISVKNKLPEVTNGEFSRSVLVIDSGGQMAVAWRNALDYDKEVWATDNGKCVCVDDVEYWCELPEPPNMD